MTDRIHNKGPFGFGVELTNALSMYGDRFEKTAHNPVTRMYCYKRTTPEGSIYYGVFRAQNRGGKPRYPVSSHFGFGRALCIRGDEKRSLDKVRFYLEHGFEAGRYPGTN